MGTETTSATYRRPQNPLVTKVSTELLESKGTDSEHLLQINNYPALLATEVSFLDCVSDVKSFSDNSFSGICGKELHFLLDLTLSNEKLRYTCNSFSIIKPIYVALRPSNTLVLQDLLSACLRHAS